MLSKFLLYNINENERSQQKNANTFSYFSKERGIKETKFIEACDENLKFKVGISIFNLNFKEENKNYQQFEKACLYKF